MAVTIFHRRKSSVKARWKQGSVTISPKLTLQSAIVCCRMKRRKFFWALTIAVVFSALLFGGCATVQSRISAHPEIYQSLSPQDQALVSQGRIREGMTQNAVWLAWGSPEQKMVGAARGRPVETWLYLEYSYAYPPYPYGYGGYGGYGGFGGFGTVAVFHTHSHRGLSFQDGLVCEWSCRIFPIPRRTVSILGESAR